MGNGPAVTLTASEAQEAAECVRFFLEATRKGEASPLEREQARRLIGRLEAPPEQPEQEPTRTILMHLSVEVARDDPVSVDEAQQEVEGALEVGLEGVERKMSVEVVLAEEIG